MAKTLRCDQNEAMLNALYYIFAKCVIIRVPLVPMTQLNHSMAGWMKDSLLKVPGVREVGSFHEILRSFSSVDSTNDPEEKSSLGTGLAPLPIPHETVSERITQRPRRNFNGQTNEN